MPFPAGCSSLLKLLPWWCRPVSESMWRRTLEDELASLEPALKQVLQAIANAVADITIELRSAPVDKSGDTNQFGDQQLQADVRTDEIIYRHLSESGCVETTSSEEMPEMRPAGGKGYSVAYDPLDGSSIFSANFSVGSIFGVWPGGEMVGQRGRDQSAAVYGLYGPKAVLVVARPASDTGEFIAQQFTLENGVWCTSNDRIKIGEAKYIAPSNFRCTADNAEYRGLIMRCMEEGYSLRYSGGMVPDVHHILSKGGGLFCCPSSKSFPAKLRLLFECAPMALIVEACGGSSYGPKGCTLDQVISTPNDRTSISLGSKQEVKKSLLTLQNQ
ncbi:hypothetical protein BSKO_10005 [Bryopsis sp. KO-2023]|nr:hypothetical protein BSKO_10005 [Bryopsis sp. KO-2023]